MRALQAYRRDAQHSLLQWKQWRNVRCPILLIHGLQSDCLFEATIRRMSRGKNVALMHLPDTGHAPLLADRNQIHFIRQWLCEPQHSDGEWSVLHAAPRDRHAATPLPFAPLQELK